MMNTKKFIKDATEKMKRQVGDRKAIVAMSFGVDSAVVAALAKRALPSDQFESWYIDTGFMRKDEYAKINPLVQSWGLDVRLHEAAPLFFRALRYETVTLSGVDAEGETVHKLLPRFYLTDGEEKRKEFRNTFYTTFGELIHARDATCLLQGTNAADLVMYARGQTQHNVNIPHKEYGIQVMVEPVITLYKPQVREVARALGLPRAITERQPFPGPGLMVRCLGPVNEEKIAIVREAQQYVENAAAYLYPFQSIAAISGDETTGMTEGKKAPGHHMILVRVIESTDAMTAKAIPLPPVVWKDLEAKIRALPMVGHVLQDLTPKPPATIEYY